MAMNNVNNVFLCGETGHTFTDVLTSVIAEGKCEQSSTPSPDNPVPIVCNNGTIGISYQSDLPSEYEELIYVTFNGTQIVDTGLYISYNDEIQSKFIGTVNQCWVYGCNPTNPRVTCYLASTGNQRWGNVAKDATGITTNTLYTLVQNKTAFTLNGTSYAFPSGSAFTTSSTLTIGNCNGSTGTPYFSGNFYYMKVYQNNTLAAELIPAKRKNDNVVGFYDIVRNTFIAPSTGTLTAGLVKYEMSVTGVQEVLTDDIGNTAACDNLFAVGTYKDTQNMLSGIVTRNVGVKVLDGTENWTAYNGGMYFALGGGSSLPATDVAYCSHFSYAGSNVLIVNLPTGGFTITVGGNCSFKSSDTTTLANWTNWLKAQYAAGTPVIIVYPLANTSTETSSKSGLLRSPVTITSSSLSDLVVNTTIGNRYIQYGTYANCPTITDVDCMHIPWINNSLVLGFVNSTNLTSVTNINNNVNNAYAAFRDCSSLPTTVSLPPSVTNIEFTYEGCNGFVNLANATLPPYATKMYGTFINCRNMVTPPNLPLGVTDVRNTFRNCRSLISTPVIMPTAINRMDNTFRDCTNLTDIKTIPNSVDTLIETFSGCGSLTNGCTIPDSVVSMLSTFYGSAISDAGIVNITWGNSVSELPQTFMYCRSLYNPVINIPNSVTNMNSTFRGCTGLYDASNINLGNVSRLIETFQSCSSLRTAPNIPASVTNVYHVFGDCSNLTGDVYVASHNVYNAKDICYGVANSSTPRVNVHIPGEGTNTYNSFISAGYTTNAAEPNKKQGVLLITDMP